MDDLFYARIDDLCARADRGELAFSQFLNESESARAEDYVNSLGRAGYLLWGGYRGAERLTFRLSRLDGPFSRSGG